MAVNKNSVAYMKEYLKYAMEFEKYVYIWTRAMNEANEIKAQIYDNSQNLRVAQAANERRVNTLSYSTEAERTRKEKEIEKYGRKSKKALIALIICLALTIACCFVPKIEVVLYFVLLFFMFELPICLTVLTLNKSKCKKLKNEIAVNLNSDSERRQSLIMQSQAKQFEENLQSLAVKENALSKRQEEIKTALMSAKKELQQIYSCNALPDKYRNLTAVVTLYEYLQTGRCNTIQGHGGIYDTYETERIHLAQLQQMIEINQRLSNIEDNQRYICRELRQVNNTLSHISSTLGEIEKTNARIAENTAISAAANQQTAAAAQWMAWNAWANGY